MRFWAKAATPTLVTGRWHSTWGMAGIPGAGSWNTTLAGVNLSSTSAMVAGQIPFTDPGSGSSYLARFVGAVGQPGKLLLCDRLWHNGGFTAVTSAQTINSAAFPARDVNGSTNGVGVFVGMEYSATGAANTPTITVSYTNQAGTAGRTGSNLTTSSAPPAGTFVGLTMQAGDTGVQSVQTVAFTSAPTAGSVNLVAYRVIAALECAQAYQASALDLVTGGMAQMFNGSVPYLVFIPTSTTASALSGGMTVTQG